MPALQGFAEFNPDKDIPSLEGKVIFVTGGTAGLGAQCVKAFAHHNPAHIYFSGRNKNAANTLISQIKSTNPSVSLTFVEMNLSSLSSVKSACRLFNHDRLDILMCNAGIMDVPPEVSVDGYEIHFATNHLGHSMVIQQLLLTLLRTAEKPATDVRIVILTSLGWRVKSGAGIAYDTLETKQEGVLTAMYRYGQSKFANLVYAKELARRYPSITTVSVHPGVVETDLVLKLRPYRRRLVYMSQFVKGKRVLTEAEGVLSSLWTAAGAHKNELVNGGFYEPVGVLGKIDSQAADEQFAKKLWDYTQKILARFE